MASRSICSEQLFEPSDCKTCIFNYSTHSDRVHRIVSWNGDEVCAVAHYNVLALAHNSEAGFFERLAGPGMGIHRAGTPVDGPNRSHGDATERSGDGESIFGIVKR